ncbi:uncharacterized protein CC84DRAFT_1206740 [Paraphaeosphaeria sporulosa]|uniref:Extracellular membrane protein CFEM domain-containing protein n=1 Tax=Paraphaeosphaeria sporulosa TaxID=1460663 RepID=A0A177CCC6_9PLEO|nr:uncharacterized protein CC84DRAFT_1206740 [Paraphaeosphaeria sporulosa]OAG05305.1 hypothetical protein CC84DRAFT_1206740 [Paraphaeosphaeria sporulosa]
MAELDNDFWPFDAYPGYKLMAPCMRDCDHILLFNGCDNSGCWCKKNNLDRRTSSLERCASTSCTFADMNTATDVSILSSIQLQYCVDRNLSPEGMTMPSTALAQPTESSSSESPLETGGSQTGSSASVPGVTGGTGLATRTRPSSGPTDTGAPASSSSSTATPNSSPSNNASLSTAAKAGIAIGAIFCVLLAVLIAILLVRRRKRTPAYPPPQYSSAPPGGHTVPAPLHVQTNNGAGAGSGFIAPAPVREDVSPISEKTPAFSQAREVRPGVVRKEVPLGSASPPVQAASPAPTEVLGSTAPERYEVHGHAAAGGNGGRWVYEMQGGGTGRAGAVELGGAGRDRASRHCAYVYMLHFILFSSCKSYGYSASNHGTQMASPPRHTTHARDVMGIEKDFVAGSLHLLERPAGAPRGAAPLFASSRLRSRRQYEVRSPSSNSTNRSHQVALTCIGVTEASTARTLRVS